MQETPELFRRQVRERFQRVADEPDQEETFPIGPESAKALGYDADEINSLPLSVTESFAGVGNPLSLDVLQSGQTVLDVGSGAGLDSILAARRVGPTGKVIGIEMTEAMINKARRNVELLQLKNVEFVHGQADGLPLPDAIVDVAITNGVLNLCPEKPKVLEEVFRVLRPGSRLQMADILLHPDVTHEEVATKGSWSD